MVSTNIFFIRLVITRLLSGATRAWSVKIVSWMDITVQSLGCWPQNSLWYLVYSAFQSILHSLPFSCVSVCGHASEWLITACSLAFNLFFKTCYRDWKADERGINSKMAQNWIEFDKKSCSSIFVSRENNECHNERVWEITDLHRNLKKNVLRFVASFHRFRWQIKYCKL